MRAPLLLPLLLLLLPPAILAHSSPNPPIRSYDFIARPHIVKLASGALSLSFSAYNRSFEFQLSKNRRLIHPSAVVEIHGAPDAASSSDADPLLTTGSERIIHSLSAATVFDGLVLVTGPDGRKHEDGWARITFASADIDPSTSFDGVVSSNTDGIFHVRHIDHYRFAKRPADIEVASPFSRSPGSWSASLIIFRDEPVAQVTDRWGPISSCVVSDPGHPLSPPRLRNSSPAPISPLANFDVFIDRASNITSSPAEDDPADSPAPASCLLPDNTETYNKYLDWIERNVKNKLARRAAGSTGCPSKLMVLPMGVAADCTYVAAYGSTSAALQAILSAWNSASKTYENAFNVQLAVTRVNLQTACSQNDPKLVWNQPCSTAYTIANRLSDFSNWRGNVQGSSDGIGLWHLMTQCSTQPSVGIAWLNMLCMQTTSSQVSNGVTQYVSGTGVSSIVPVEWKVVAHEIGHNFGAYHDCMSSTCPCPGPNSPCQCTPCSPDCDCRGDFIMHPLDNAATDNFSTSSIATICGQFPTLGHCLKPAGSILSLTAGICGNGVKELNEECDCGLAADCANDPCCDGPTCKLKNGALCDDLNDSCCSNCKPKVAGTICHASTGSCDINLTCDGKNVSCATNSFLSDGATCKTTAGVSAQCASGICTSRDLQCSASGTINTASACPAFESQCVLYCQDSGGTCFLLNGNFRDGTPCGSTGKCYSGKCIGGDFLSTVFTWFQAYPQYAIPIACFGALILFMMMYSLIRCCCCSPFRKPVVPASVRQQLRQQQREYRRQRQASTGSIQAFQAGSAMNLQQQQQNVSNSTPQASRQGRAHSASLSAMHLAGPSAAAAAGGNGGGRPSSSQYSLSGRPAQSQSVLSPAPIRNKRASSAIPGSSGLPTMPLSSTDVRVSTNAAMMGQPVAASAISRQPQQRRESAAIASAHQLGPTHRRVSSMVPTSSFVPSPHGYNDTPSLPESPDISRRTTLRRPSDFPPQQQFHQYGTPSPLLPAPIRQSQAASSSMQPPPDAYIDGDDEYVV